MSARTGSSRDALLLIDLQESFFEAPSLRESRPAMVESVSALVAGAHEAECPVFLITTQHSRDRSTWTLNMLDDDQGYLFSGDPGTEPIHELDTAQMTRLEKTRDSAFFGTDLLLRLRNLEVDRVVFAGVSAHACIAQSVRDAYAHNVRSALITDAIDDDSPEYFEHVLEVLERDRQTDQLTTREILATWSC